jgi:hypothetical protein
MSVFEVFGVAGIAISILAYVPQVVHLGREHCSAGISRRAWAMWLASSALIGTLALYRRDPVFHPAPGQHADVGRDHSVPGA